MFLYSTFYFQFRLIAHLSFPSFSFQSPFGTPPPSTRSRPTSTSPPCRQSSPLISPSTSRPALLPECFWRTWASKTSSEWSSAVSQCTENMSWQGQGGTRRVSGKKKKKLYIKAVRGFELHFSHMKMQAALHCSWQFNLVAERAVGSAQCDVILMTQSTAVSCSREGR